ncbi:MAG: nicotinate-nucleotide adenylyltransferase [Tannerella sp.]|jgi:nicotinate-nucleotide adenylyltransferase|nr:nicotinate-nucleotide adenylyltransferase [Tannerella sp.]
MKNTGIFSGSFNPVHIGHLALANWLCEYVDLDEIWFLVTPQNPLKDRDELMDYDLRFNMVKASIAGYPKFKVSDIECSLPLPSYTIDTLRALQTIYPDRLFHLIIGADSWANINQWKDAQALINDFHILIYPRKNYEQSDLPLLPQIRKVDAPLVDISSSFIRNAIGEGKDIRFFLPEPIRNAVRFFQDKK